MASANSQINGTDEDGTVPLASQVIGGKEHPSHTLVGLAGDVVDLPPALGQGTMAQSAKVVIASDQSAVLTRNNDGILTATTDIARPADTTAYAIGDAWANSTSAPTAGGFTFTGAVRASGKSAVLTDLIVVSSNNAATTLQGEIWIFDTAVMAINDNASFNPSAAQVKTMVARIPFTLVAGVNSSSVHLMGLGIGVTAVGSADLRFLVRVTNAYTPANAEVLTFRAKFAPAN